ncbi:MAG: Hpt domain-containing protein [Deltaproteobacteria bacterium HGW-Deltaproteobacteria-21]|nr:MAG: Hpt domain-containing protein [Deltaproteobacteria bacterium HGW-Deltaproteobacteria-21]
MNSKESIIVGNEKIIVRPDPDLADEATWYLGQLGEYAKNIKEAVFRGDFETVLEIGHRVKGSAESFGFDGASDIGRALEQAAKDNDAAAVKAAADRFSDYLRSVELVFE